MGITSEMHREMQEEVAFEGLVQHILDVKLKYFPVPTEDEEGEPININDYADILREQIVDALNEDPHAYQYLLDQYPRYIDETYLGE